MSESLPRLTAVARRCLEGIHHFSQIHEEQLAEQLRSELGLSAFPQYEELSGACEALGIRIERISTRVPGLDGVNAWEHGEAPVIALDFDTASARLETTLCHELREVLENSFQRLGRSYVGIDTHENKVMNPRSDRFASYLLMPTEPTRRALVDLGFDALGFSRRYGRSLPSVLLRMRELYGAKNAPPDGPVAGVWLFEAPWDQVSRGAATIGDLVLKQTVRLGGFKPEKDVQIYFPRKGCAARKLQAVADAVLRGTTVSGEVNLDLFGERSYWVIVEPVSARGSLWRVLFVAVRRESKHWFDPWVARREPVWLGALLPAA